MNKKIIQMLLLAIPCLAGAQQPLHSLTRIWETDTIVAIPESVLPDATDKFLFVSLIDGGGWDVDGKGGVAKLSLDGKQYKPDWITGLNAPKGLGRWGNKLYVADVSEIVVMDIPGGKIDKKIPVAGANGLNDITVDDKGIVYISDSKAGKVYRMENDVPVLFMENLAGANGLKAAGSDLYILANKALLKADASKNITKITDLPHGGDGVELAGNGDFIVSEWIGDIFYVYADGRKELLLDTQAQKKNTADIHYDQKKRILYVPGFNAKTVAAYKLQWTPGAQTPEVFLMNGNRLAEWKKKVQQQDPSVQNLATALRGQADKFLGMTPLSVMDKPTMPVSGNKHDYMSQAPYYWYDSSKPNGLPYMSRDGQRNPEIYKITDRRFIGELSNACQVLGLAWYLTGEEKYAAKASALLRHWFIEDASRMNPNLNYAQAVPGLNDGRGTGIIESISLMGITDASGLLHGSASWTTGDEKALKNWYTEFLDWMLTSRNGKAEHAAKNNHGAWYLAQATNFALFTGNRAKAKELAEEGRMGIDKQIEKDGRMPLELARTNALHYTNYCLEAWFKLAMLSETVGVDLWHYTNAQGAGIRTALDWVRPYALGEKKWEYQEISGFNQAECYPLLFQAAAAYKEPRYASYVPAFSGKDGGNVMMYLLYMAQLKERQKKK